MSVLFEWVNEIILYIYIYIYIIHVYININIMFIIVFVSIAVTAMYAFILSRMVSSKRLYIIFTHLPIFPTPDVIFISCFVTYTLW